MSKLRSDKWSCQNVLEGSEKHPPIVVCGDIATYRCNACRQYFCDECWSFHLEMSVVELNGVPLANQTNVHGRNPKEGAHSSST